MIFSQNAATASPTSILLSFTANTKYNSTKPKILNWTRRRLNQCGSISSSMTRAKAKATMLKAPYTKDIWCFTHR